MGYAAPGGIAGANAPRSVAVPIASRQALVEDPAQLEIPSEHATLKEIHKGTNGKLIIHIQDAHANLSGQKSIALALDAFMRQYEIPVILVEGGDRDVTLDEVKEIADQKTWDVLAGKLLYESVITGPEYLNLTSDYPMKLMGIEYLDLYENNLEAYASLVRDRKLILQYLRKIRKSLTRIKNRLYPKELLEFEEAKNHREKTGEFVQVYDQLLDMALRAGVSLDPFPEVLKLRSLQSKEQAIDFDQANREQAALLEALSQKGASDQVKHYLKKQRQTGYSQIFQHTFLNHIFKLAEANTIQTHTLTALLKYREYLGEFTGLKMDLLSEELEFLEDFVYRQLLPDENAKKVRAIDRYLVLLEKAYSIEMSSHEFRMLKENEPFFNTSSWQSFMNELSEQLGYKEDLITYEPYLEQADARLKRFYTVVNERDQAFLENSSRILGEKNQDIAFMIAGGYHTENLTKLMRDEGYSYAVIAPIIKHETDQAKYEDILLTPLNAEHKKFDNSTSMTKGFVGQYYRLSGGKIGNPDEVVYAHSGIIKTRVPANLLVAALRGARAKSTPNSISKDQASLTVERGHERGQIPYSTDEPTSPSRTSSGSPPADLTRNFDAVDLSGVVGRTDSRGRATRETSVASDKARQTLGARAKKTRIQWSLRTWFIGFTLIAVMFGGLAEFIARYFFGVRFFSIDRGGVHISRDEGDDVAHYDFTKEGVIRQEEPKYIFDSTELTTQLRMRVIDRLEKTGEITSEEADILRNKPIMFTIHDDKNPYPLQVEDHSESGLHITVIQEEDGTVHYLNDSEDMALEERMRVSRKREGLIQGGHGEAGWRRNLASNWAMNHFETNTTLTPEQDLEVGEEIFDWTDPTGQNRIGTIFEIAYPENPADEPNQWNLRYFAYGYHTGDDTVELISETKTKEGLRPPATWWKQDSAKKTDEAGSRTDRADRVPFPNAPGSRDPSEEPTSLSRKSSGARASEPGDADLPMSDMAFINAMGISINELPKTFDSDRLISQVSMRLDANPKLFIPKAKGFISTHEQSTKRQLSTGEAQLYYLLAITLEKALLKLGRREVSKRIGGMPFMSSAFLKDTSPAAIAVAKRFLESKTPVKLRTPRGLESERDIISSLVHFSGELKTVLLTVPNEQGKILLYPNREELMEKYGGMNLEELILAQGSMPLKEHDNAIAAAFELGKKGPDVSDAITSELYGRAEEAGLIHRLRLDVGRRIMRAIHLPNRGDSKINLTKIDPYFKFSSAISGQFESFGKVSIGSLSGLSDNLLDTFVSEVGTNRILYNQLLNHPSIQSFVRNVVFKQLIDVVVNKSRDTLEKGGVKLSDFDRQELRELTQEEISRMSKESSMKKVAEMTQDEESDLYERVQKRFDEFREQEYGEEVNYEEDGEAPQTQVNDALDEEISSHVFTDDGNPNFSHINDKGVVSYVNLQPNLEGLVMDQEKDNEINEDASSAQGFDLEFDPEDHENYIGAWPRNLFATSKSVDEVIDQVKVEEEKVELPQEIQPEPLRGPPRRRRVSRIASIALTIGAMFFLPLIIYSTLFFNRDIPQIVLSPQDTSTQNKVTVDEDNPRETLRGDLIYLDRGDWMKGQGKYVWVRDDQDLDAVLIDMRDLEQDGRGEQFAVRNDGRFYERVSGVIVDLETQQPTGDTFQSWQGVRPDHYISVIDELVQRLGNSENSAFPDATDRALAYLTSAKKAQQEKVNRREELLREAEAEEVLDETGGLTEKDQDHIARNRKAHQANYYPGGQSERGQTPYPFSKEDETTDLSGARSDDKKLRYVSPESVISELKDDQIIQAYEDAIGRIEYDDPGRHPRIPTLGELLESFPIGVYPKNYMTSLQARIARFNEVNTPLPFSKRNVTYSHLRKPKEPYDDAFKNFVAAKQGVLSWIEVAKALNLTVEEAKKLNIQKDYLGEEEGDLRILIEDVAIVDRLREVMRHMDTLHGREAVFAGLINIRDLGTSLGLSEKNINQKTIFWEVKADEIISLLNHNRRLINALSNTKYILFSMISRRSFVKLKPLIKALESPKQDGLWTQEELAKETGLSIKSVSKGLIYIRNRIGFDILNYNYQQLNMSFIHDVLTVNQKASLMRLLGAVEELGGIATANEVRDYLAVNHGMDFRLESVSNVFADNAALFDFVNKRRGRQKRPILERLREYHLGDPVSARRQLLLYEYGIETKNTLLGAAVLRARVHYGQRYMYQTGRSRSAVGGSAYRYHALPRVFEAVFAKSTKKQTKSPASSTIRVFENALKVMIDEGPERDSAGTGPNNDVVQYFRETVPRALKLTGKISHMKDLDRFKAMLVKAKSKKYPIMPTSYPITDIGIGKKPKKSATDADSVQKAALAGGPHTAREAGTRAYDGYPESSDPWPEHIEDLNDKDDGNLDYTLPIAEASAKVGGDADRQKTRVSKIFTGTEEAGSMESFVLGTRSSPSTFASHFLEAIGLTDYTRLPSKRMTISGSEIEVRTLTLDEREDPLSLPRGLEILDNELAPTTKFELIYREGRLIGIFPVLDPTQINEISRQDVFLFQAEDLGYAVHYLDLSDYYLDFDAIPKFDANWNSQEAIETMNKLADQSSFDSSVLLAYRSFLSRIDPFWGNVSKYGQARKSYVYAEITKGDTEAGIRILGFNPGEFEQLLEENDISPNKAMHQIIFPVYPWVYHPATHFLTLKRTIPGIMTMGKDDHFLIIGPGSGIDTWVSWIHSGLDPYVIGLTGVEMSNVKTVAKIAGFNVIAEENNGIVKPDGTPVFDRTFRYFVWDMPAVKFTVVEHRTIVRKRIDKYWDGDLNGDILNAFADNLNLIADKDFVDGQIWNVHYPARGDGEDYVKSVFTNQGFDVTMKPFFTGPDEELSEGTYIVYRIQQTQTPSGKNTKGSRIADMPDLNNSLDRLITLARLYDPSRGHTDESMLNELEPYLMDKKYLTHVLKRIEEAYHVQEHWERSLYVISLLIQDHLSQRQSESDDVSSLEPTFNKFNDFIRIYNQKNHQNEDLPMILFKAVSVFIPERADYVKLASTLHHLPVPFEDEVEKLHPLWKGIHLRNQFSVEEYGDLVVTTPALASAVGRLRSLSGESGSDQSEKTRGELRRSVVSFVTGLFKYQDASIVDFRESLKQVFESNIDALIEFLLDQLEEDRINGVSIVGLRGMLLYVLENERAGYFKQNRGADATGIPQLRDIFLDPSKPEHKAFLQNMSLKTKYEDQSPVQDYVSYDPNYEEYYLRALRELIRLKIRLEGRLDNQSQTSLRIKSLFGESHLGLYEPLLEKSATPESAQDELSRLTDEGYIHRGTARSIASIHYKSVTGVDRNFGPQLDIGPQSLTRSPNRQLEASYASSGIQLVNTVAGETKWLKRTHKFLLNEKESRGIAFDPRSQYLAAAQENSIRIYDAETGDIVHSIEGHGNAGIVHLSFSGDSKLLASLSSDNTIKLWDMSNGELLQTLPVELSVRSRRDVFSAAVGFDADRTLKLRDAWGNTRFWRPLDYTAGVTPVTGARLVQSKEGSRALRWSLSILVNLGLEYSEVLFWKADEIRRSVPEVPVTLFDHAVARMSFVVEQIASLAKRHFTAAVVRGLVVTDETRLVESIDGWEVSNGELNVNGDLFQKNLRMALARRAMLRKYGGDLIFVTFNKDLLHDEGFMAKMQAEGIKLTYPGKINKPAAFMMTEDNARSLMGRGALPKGSSLILYEPTSRDLETGHMSPFTQIFITAIEFNRLAIQGLDAQDMDPIVSTLIARSTGLERHRVQDIADELIDVTEITQQIIKFAQEIQFPLTPVDFKYLGEMAIRLAEIATNA